MIKYITENDKNGKARFYKVIDGKKKVTSRVEYEAHKDDVEEDIPEVDTTTTSVKVEEYAQFTLEDVNAADADTETCCEAENVIDFKSAEITTDTPTDIPMKETVFSSSDEYRIFCNEAAFEIIKSLVVIARDVRADKMKLMISKKCGMICYRNRVICTLVSKSGKDINSVKFFDKSVETRKHFTIFDISSVNDLSKYKNEILSQLDFVDTWLLGAKKNTHSTEAA